MSTKIISSYFIIRQRKKEHKTKCNWFSIELLDRNKTPSSSLQQALSLSLPVFEDDCIYDEDFIDGFGKKKRAF